MAETLKGIYTLGMENPRCGGCGGPHRYDTVVTSALWNEVIRPLNGTEYLCFSCIVQEFVLAGVSFSGEVVGECFGEEKESNHYEMRLGGKQAKDLECVTRENNSLRWHLRELIDAGQSVLSHYAGSQHDDVPLAIGEGRYNALRDALKGAKAAW